MSLVTPFTLSQGEKADALDMWLGRRARTCGPGDAPHVARTDGPDGPDPPDGPDVPDMSPARRTRGPTGRSCGPAPTARTCGPDAARIMASARVDMFTLARRGGLDGCRLKKC